MTALLEAERLALPKRLQPTGLRLGAELACLIGPNGSGKTSLLHALAGINRPGGRVRIDGVATAGLPAEARARLLAFVPASRDVAWPVRAGDLIRLGLPAAHDPADLEEAVDALEIRPFLERRVDTLSTGERSRILIARAIAARPRLLLLDEPAANLDPHWQLRLMEMLVALARRGHGVIAAMHDLDLAGRYADRLLLMESGAVAADGAPREILSAPLLADIFSIVRGPEGWRPLSPAERPRSSR